MFPVVIVSLSLLLLSPSPGGVWRVSAEVLGFVPASRSSRPRPRRPALLPGRGRHAAHRPQGGLPDLPQDGHTQRVQGGSSRDGLMMIHWSPETPADSLFNLLPRVCFLLLSLRRTSSPRLCLEKLSTRTSCLTFPKSWIYVCSLERATASCCTRWSVSCLLNHCELNETVWLKCVVNICCFSSVNVHIVRSSVREHLHPAAVVLQRPGWDGSHCVTGRNMFKKYNFIFIWKVWECFGLFSLFKKWIQDASDTKTEWLQKLWKLRPLKSIKKS